jgi:hypothetical protein
MHVYMDQDLMDKDLVSGCVDCHTDTYNESVNDPDALSRCRLSTGLCTEMILRHVIYRSGYYEPPV